MTIDDEEYVMENETETNTKFTSFYLIMGCLLSSQFLGSMDSTMVVTLLGRISSDLQSQQHISWIATSYLLAGATFQPLFGKLSDVLGRRLMLNICQLIFALGCTICAMSPTLGWLVFGRLITGVGGGGLKTLSSICVSDIVGRKERGLYQGYISIAAQMGSLSGGIIAGIFDAIWGWKSAFWVQVPCMLFIAFLVWLFLDLEVDNKHKHLSNSEKLKSIDWIGSLLLVTSLLSVLLLFGTNGDELSKGGLLWFALIIYSGFGFYKFYQWENSIETPVIPVKLFQHRTVFYTCFNSLFSQMNYFSAVFYIPFYWTSVQNLTPFEAGYRLIPNTIVACMTSVVVGYAIKRMGRYHKIHLFGGMMLIIGSALISTQNRNSGAFFESVFSLPLRIGTSTNFNVMLVSMISSVPDSEQALVSSIHYGVKSSGATLGISISNAVMQSSLKYFVWYYFDNINIPEGWDKSMINSIKGVALKKPSSGYDEKLPLVIRSAIINSYANACHCVYLFMVFTALVMFYAISKTEENNLDDDFVEEEEEEEEEGEGEGESHRGIAL